jgi:hypothetical protein
MSDCNQTIIVASYARAAKDFAQAAAQSACIAQQSAGATGATGATGFGATGATGLTLTNIISNPQSASYTLQLSDAGKYINISTGGVTVPNAIFASGDVISVYNNSSSSQTITQAIGVTMYLAGTPTTGNRILAQRGIATILCVGSNEFTIIGGGLS